MRACVSVCACVCGWVGGSVCMSVCVCVRLLLSWGVMALLRERVCVHVGECVSVVKLGSHRSIESVCVWV